jgi:predicted nucleic acid-binding protein
LKAERDRWLSVIAVLPWSNEASELFGEIKADLERFGRLIDDFDIAIGAIAIAHGCSVITANLSHFQKIGKLKSKNWK